MSAAGKCMSAVLVVDDDPVTRRLIRATLAPVGFEVIEAGDGEQALAVLRERLPDLVLMDVSMPVMDGFSACAELRKLPRGDRVPVVMITGLDDVQSIERAFEVGATDFITKPINWPILAHRVTQHQVEHRARGMPKVAITLDHGAGPGLKIAASEFSFP